MTKKLLHEAILDRPLLCDGAMGTQLMIAGLEQGNCGEAWNLTHPEKVLAIQRRYVQAGSDCILTNTFGGSRIMLNRHSQAEHVVEINKAAVKIAREAFGNNDDYVIGDVGPFGGLLQPFGEFTEAQVTDAFTEQAAALVDGVASRRRSGAPSVRRARRSGRVCLPALIARPVPRYARPAAARRPVLARRSRTAHPDRRVGT